MSLVGRLEDLALPDIFQIISLSKKTGTLVVRSRRGTGMVVFKDGQVIQAASDGIRDSLGNMLVSQGMIDEQTLSQALAQQKKDPDKPLGMILIETGAFNGIGFAIPIDIATDVYKQIRDNGYVVRGWLGIEYDYIEGQDRI